MIPNDVKQQQRLVRIAAKHPHLNHRWRKIARHIEFVEQCDRARRQRDHTREVDAKPMYDAFTAHVAAIDAAWAARKRTE